MTTTVTTTTVTTMTTAGVAALGIVVTLTLIAFLVLKEVLGAAPGERSQRWARALNIGILPLLFAFAIIAAQNVAHVI